MWLIRGSSLGASALIVGLVAGMALGAIRPQVRLPAVTKSADTIVAGTVISIEPTDQPLQVQRLGRTYDFTAWRARVRVEQLIKGESSAKEVTVQFPGLRPDQNGVVGGPLAVLERLEPGERVVALLTSRDGGQVYSFANEYRSAIRIADSNAVTQLLASPSNPGQVDDYVAALVSATLNSASRDRVEQNVSDLVDLKGREAATPLNVAMDRSTDAGVRAVILGGLLGTGDYSQLAATVDTVSRTTADQFVLGKQMILATKMALVTDPVLVRKYYFPLLKDPSDFVRRSAAYAIRKAKLSDAVPLLIQGLKDADPDMRYQCLMGLAETLDRGGDWAPSKDNFTKDERAYIKRWQDWWVSSGQFEFKESPAINEPLGRAYRSQEVSGRESVDGQAAATSDISRTGTPVLTSTTRQASTTRSAPGTWPARSARSPAAPSDMDHQVSSGKAVRNNMMSESSPSAESRPWWILGVLVMAILTAGAAGGVYLRARRKRGAIA